MTDNPDYINAEMEGQETLEYAKSELGQKTDVQTLRLEDLDSKVRSFTKDLAYQGWGIEVTEYENGVLIEGLMEDTIINPNKMIGQKPRFWVSEQHFNIYFKKEGLYYLIRMEV